MIQCAENDYKLFYLRQSTTFLNKTFELYTENKYNCKIYLLVLIKNPTTLSVHYSNIKNDLHKSKTFI